jgi:hypothetical protein
MDKKCRSCDLYKPIESFYSKMIGCKECWNAFRRNNRPKLKCDYCSEEFRPGVQGRYKFCSEKCRFLKKVTIDEKSGCWLWNAAIDAKGYGSFVEYKGPRRSLAHRASYKLFKGELENSLDVLHSCNTRSCVNPEHLREGTNRDNALDMLKDRGGRRFKEQDVIEIRRLSEAGMKAQLIANLYRVGCSTICGIIKRRNWKHI